MRPSRFRRLSITISRARLSITIRISRNPEAWGSECDEITASRAARHLTEAIEDFCADEYPDAVTETTVTNDVVGVSGLPQVSVDPADGPAQDVEFAVTMALEDLWTDCLGFALAGRS